MTKRTLLLPAAVVAGLILSTPSRADRLDGQLQQRMSELVEKLRAKYKNVGVLRFRVQEGGRKESYDSPLSARMAERLETLLITHNAAAEADALGVIHDAGAAAAAKKVGAWHTSPKARAKLFAYTYPLAWGRKQVSPDAFLTGKVTLSPDRKKTTVALECFDKDAPNSTTTLGTLDLDTDRFILRDLGYGFVVSRAGKGKLTTSRSTKDEDPFILEEVNKSNPTEDGKGAAPPVARDGAADPDNIGGIAVEILVNGKPASIRPAGTAGDAIRWQVECPPPSAKVAIRLKNMLTEKRLGVVLRLNGVSTLNEQRDDPESAYKWVVNPRRAKKVEGFYLLDTESVKHESATEPRGLKVKKKPDEAAPPAGETKQEEGAKETVKADDGDAPRPASGPRLKAFKVLVGEAAKAAELGEKAGHIDIDVFEEGSAKEDDEALISTKGLPPSKEKLARSSYLGLRSALLKSSKLKTEVVKLDERGGLTTKKEVIVPDKEALVSNAKVTVTDLANPRLVARLTIKVIAPDALQGD